MSHVNQLLETTKYYITKLNKHPLNSEITNLEQLKIFLSYHIYESWDFMSLLKSYQQQVTSVSVPWLPNETKINRRLSNTFNLEIESFKHNDTYLSQFELLYTSMLETNVSRSSIDEFIKNIENIVPIKLALRLANAPSITQQFTMSTMDIIEHSPVHQLTAALLFGRQPFIPAALINFSTPVAKMVELNLPVLHQYLLNYNYTFNSTAMVLRNKAITELCRKDKNMWNEANQIIEIVYKQRLLQFDAILNEINAVKAKTA